MPLLAFFYQCQPLSTIGDLLSDYVKHDNKTSQQSVKQILMAEKQWRKYHNGTKIPVPYRYQQVSQITTVRNSIANPPGIYQESTRKPLSYEYKANVPLPQP
jgi:hypothetical protein